jgi:hypothetical protein
MLEYEVVKKADIPPPLRTRYLVEMGEWLALAELLRVIEPGQAIRIEIGKLENNTWFSSLRNACKKRGVRASVTKRGTQAFVVRAGFCQPSVQPRKTKLCAVCQCQFSAVNPLMVVCGESCRKRYLAAAARTKRRCDGKIDRAEMDRQLAGSRKAITRRPRGWQADLECSLALASGG